MAESKKAPKKVTIIDTWNDVVDQMMRLQVLWKRHQAMGTVRLAELPIESQRVFAHMVHRQRFEFMLDFMKRYTRQGLEQLKINVKPTEEKEDAN